jgi:hypothetical protein
MSKEEKNKLIMCCQMVNEKTGEIFDTIHGIRNMEKAQVLYEQYFPNESKKVYMTQKDDRIDFDYGSDPVASLKKVGSF